MVVKALERSLTLYEQDETAWLETMAELVRERRFSELDYTHLGEFLADMARRDRREVESRLAMLVAHLLKWEYQPKRRSRSWRTTIEIQHQELATLIESATLRQHAESALTRIYAKAVRQAVAYTGLASDVFPADCPYHFEQLERLDLLADLILQRRR